jgi:uncharacterized protein (TIGR02145 family)
MKNLLSLVLILFVSSINYSQCPGTITYAGKTYHTIEIGDQCWLKENLNVGKMIQVNQNQSNNNIIEKYCINNDPRNCIKYGGLYQWNEAMQYSTTPGAQGICPSGWHLPTYNEFETLKSSLNSDGSVLSSNTADSRIFFSLLSGIRYDNGAFADLGISSYIWSSTEECLFYLTTNSNGIFENFNHEENGFSVRCVMDQNDNSDNYAQQQEANSNDKNIFKNNDSDNNSQQQNESDNSSTQTINTQDDNADASDISDQPIWGPVGYDYVQYYYLPDIDVFYDVMQHLFFYLNSGRWISLANLPVQYRHYDLYGGYKVVINQNKPYLRDRLYKVKYSSYKNYHVQKPIRDSRDPKYFVIKNHPKHNQWVEQHKSPNKPLPGNTQVLGNKQVKLVPRDSKPKPVQDNPQALGNKQLKIIPRDTKPKPIQDITQTLSNRQIENSNQTQKNRATQNNTQTLGNRQVQNNTQTLGNRLFQGNSQSTGNMQVQNNTPSIGDRQVQNNNRTQNNRLVQNNSQTQNNRPIQIEKPIQAEKPVQNKKPIQIEKPAKNINQTQNKDKD